jgi:hypothetical protein
MAQTGYTPILIYGSGTTGNTPSAGNLTSSSAGAELAINYFDGKLFYKDNAGVVQTLATKGTGSIGGSTTQVQYNNAGALAGSANLTFNGTTLTANALTVSNATTLSALTASTALALNGSKEVVSVTNTGTGNNVLATSPTLTTPNLGTPSVLTLTNATGLPVSTGISGLGTGVATALAVNTGSVGAFVVNGGALGTPSSGTLTNATGLPLSTGVTGTLAVANGGTGITSFGTGVATALGQNVTGSGGIALASSPTLTTPVLGAATATSINGLTISTTTGTLTLANGSTLATSGANSLTLTTTGATNVTFPTSGTLATTGGTVASFSAGTTGFTPSTATTGAVTLAGTLATTNGGTGLTSFTANQVFYASSTSAVGQSANLTFNGTTLTAAGFSGPLNGTVGATTPSTGAFTSVVSTSASGVLNRAAATQDGIALVGRAGGTGSWSVSLTPATLSASRTVTFPDSNTTIPIASQTITFSGPSTARTYTLPDAAVTLAGLATTQTFSGVNTFGNASGQLFLASTTTTQDGVVINGRAGGSASYRVTLVPTTLSASRTLTLPDNTGTVLTTGAAVTVAQGGTGLTSGTSGGIPFFSSTSAMTSSAALAANALMIGGGAGVAPSTTTTGTGILTFLGTPSSANLAAAVTDETGSGALVFGTSPTLSGATLNNTTVYGGAVTPATNTVDSVGYTGMPQNAQSAAYTLVAGDAGKTIVHPATDNNARTFTIPANGSVAYPVGTAITFVNMINTVTIAITTDTMYLAGPGTTGSRTLAAYGVATAIKVTSTSWIISGNGLT